LKNVLSFALCGAVFLGLTISCTNADTNARQNNKPETESPTETAAQEITIGSPGDDIFRTLYSTEYATLNYLVTSGVHELEAAANTIDGLIEYNNYGEALPALAESWLANEDYTVWTFKIRQGVKWVDKYGKAVAEVTAQDWADAARYINEALNASNLQYTYEGIILNASEYYSQTTEILDAETAVSSGEAASVDDYFAAAGIDPSAFISFEDVGVKALDKYTLEYTMAVPVPYFISVLSYASYLPVYGPYLEEMGDNFGMDNDCLLYNGAYVMTEYEPNVKRVFIANPLYWDKGKVYIQEYHHMYNADEVTLGPVMFLRGEVDEAYIGEHILDTWLANPETKGLVRGNKPDIANSYFYVFNFEPRFDAVYEPDNWIMAVNNENFRQSIMFGMDRIKALAEIDPYNTRLLLNNTVTPEVSVVGAGKDFTRYDALKPFSDSDYFDEAKALEYRDKAKAELIASGAALPIKVLMPFDPAKPDRDKEYLAVEQQLEALLGADFIDIIVEAGPSTWFSNEVRRTGKFAFMKCGWSASYADPQMWAEPFSYGNSYNFMYTDERKVLSDIPVINKSEETQAIVAGYYAKTDAAKTLVTDIDARFEAFAEAEAFLIQHAIIVPHSVGPGGYTASLRDPFSGMFAPYGLPALRYKGVKLLEKPMSNDEFKEAYVEWKADWAKVHASY